MNAHPEVLICRERYKYIPREVTPEHFSFERILAYNEAETNVPEEQFVELLGRKDPAKLRWIGDKNPDYYQLFERLLRQNPGARFIVLYRPLEEVAESFEARARDPEDHWPAHYDHERAVKLWNLSLNRTRQFILKEPEANVLILDYHDFFRRNETCVPLISRFLDIEFDDAVLEDWRERTTGFEKARRRKSHLDEEQLSFVRANKNRSAEAWILKRIERQFGDPDILIRGDRARHTRGDRPVDLQRLLERERREARLLRERNRELLSKTRKLERQLHEIRGSRSWSVLQVLGRIGKGLFGGGAKS